MISRLDASTQQFLDQIGFNSRRLERAQRELATGKRVNQASDDPEAVGILLNTRARLEMTAQIRSNLYRLKTEADSAEHAVAAAVKLLEHARVIGAQGATGTQTATERAGLALEIGAALEQMVAIANTNVEGRYLFSGDSDGAAAYSIDLTQAVPVSPYQGSVATRRALDARGVEIPIARTAQQIFEGTGAGENVFAALTDLRSALLANDADAARAALDTIRTATDYLNGQLAFYGSVQRQIHDGIDAAHKIETRLKTQIASLEDADIGAAVLEITNAKLQQDAAFGARAAMPRRTLFDYLG